MIKIGRIYKTNKGALVRIFRSGGGGYYSGRGCTKKTATPYNHYREDELEPASLFEINDFLELELAYGMVQTWNK